MEIASIVVLVLFGVFGGFLSGLLGVGGGIVFIPVLSYYLGQAGLEDEEFVRYLLANSLATIFFAGLISTWKQYRMQSFYPKQILVTGVAAMITGALVAYAIAAADWYSEKAFNIIFLTLLLLTLTRFLKRNKEDAQEVKETALKKYCITGLLTGVVTSLSGLGGGIIMIPLFNKYIKIDMKSASAISIGVIPLIIIPNLITYLIHDPTVLFAHGQFGYIVPGLFFPMVAGLVFAAPLGVSTAQKVSDKLLKIIFASLVIIVIINTIVDLV